VRRQFVSTLAHLRGDARHPSAARPWRRRSKAIAPRPLRPETRWLAPEGDRPVGVLLLMNCPSGGVGLSYVGLIPEARAPWLRRRLVRRPAYRLGAFCGADDRQRTSATSRRSGCTRRWASRPSIAGRSISPVLAPHPEPVRSCPSGFTGVIAHDKHPRWACTTVPWCGRAERADCFAALAARRSRRRDRRPGLQLTTSPELAPPGFDQVELSLTLDSTGLVPTRPDSSAHTRIGLPVRMAARPEEP
jgi:hypothetical protein